MTTPMNRQPQGIPAGGQFATTAHSEPEIGIPVPAPTSGPEFVETMLRVEGDFHAARRHVQHGYILMAINEMEQQCPSAASFTLINEDDLEATEILDADGEPVPDEEKDAMRDIWRYRDEDDYSGYIGDDVDIQKIRDDWQGEEREGPGAPTSGPEFMKAVAAAENEFFITRRKAQHGYMLMAIEDMKTKCPSTASFTLINEDDLEATEIFDADGEPVPDEEEDAMRDVWRYRDEDDYSLYVGEEINVRNVQDTWKP
ncbi:hypothetical protein [Arthrobacter sp. zg-Y1110]|uniref:hypothetical protein n=1 Tax=Arthrobacter sp. zg-Y1110 TaxID=2886932 RepID=UPI001D138BAE|nr:hypothetical protein [Arthrobacter sp. zg-Y1110]MCC3292398.1 hypothetical protein [Arthrobacter sp. zg-Y1110]UWX86699.1 hypothetical protein N2K99_17815 [Arthrobacter sp. zg-Y1110]